jgi:hypothetical protein
MNEIDSIFDDEHDYTVNTETSPFDKILPKETLQTSINSTRIPYLTKAGTNSVIVLKGENKYHQVIFRAFVAGFQSEWFTGVSDRSKPSYFDKVRIFFNWINSSDYETTAKTRYNVLKSFEAYEMNDRGLRSSPLYTIKPVLLEGLACSTFKKLDHEYLLTLLSLSKAAKSPEPKSLTLSSWFDLPWLRYVIGEQTYLQLESPRLLFRSFRVTIATTLLYLLQQRERWQQSSIIEFDSSYSNWQYDWNRLVLERLGKFNDQGEPEDEFSQLLLLDLVIPSAKKSLKSRFVVSGTKNLPKKITSHKSPPWQRPFFFHPHYQIRYSALEELLCAWLAACEAIQPSDIPKLKANNYARECNRSGRLIAMECTYYKGRAGMMKQPAILMAKDSWTQAMDHYMTGLSEPSLFKTRIQLEKHISGFIKNSELNLLFKIWKLPSFQKQLESELKHTDATQIFLRAMLALEDSDESYKQFNNRTGKLTDEYRNLTNRTLPVSLFSLTHIKNTAVHAGADAYREADLVNHHSHSALTEKTSYLTDVNKEWVNQAGRITRLVLHDLQNVVYQPSITAISQAVNDLELRTRIIEATHTNDIKTHSLAGPSIEIESDGDSRSTIIVSDNTDTALYFIHYITQAEALLSKLLAVRPDWVERTLIVQVEWMSLTLTRMRTVSNAKKTYAELAIHLPPLFDHLLETTE